MKNLIEIFLKEIDQEAATTRKFLSIVPKDQFGWKPHAKSMTIKQLTNHIAELPSWLSMAVHTDGIDFESTPYQPTDLNNSEELLAFFEENLKKGKEDLSGISLEKLDETWTMRSGDYIISQDTKADLIRVTINQIIHHRAQLGVDLRLLNIPIPGSYGPSADESGL